MKVLDLFCGRKGWSAAFAERGHEVVTLDFDGKFSPTYCADVMEVESVKGFDVVLASPDCRCFSVAALSRNWEMLPGGSFRPRNADAAHQLVVVNHAVSLIKASGCQFFAVENPQAMMRKVVPSLRDLPRATVTYCQYGEARMKPTDIWGVFPESWVPKRCDYGDPCHPYTPRGCKTVGTQAIDGADKRAMIPKPLSLDFCLACERDFDGIGRGTPSVNLIHSSPTMEDFIAA